MLDALLNSVLPVFAIVGIGMVLARAGLFDIGAAQIINRFLFYVGIPALAFGLLARSDVREYDWLVLGGYVGIEAFVYVVAFAIFRLVLKRDWAECAVLAMGAIFANHLMYVLPIAVAEFGPGMGPRIIALITLDTMLFYFGNMIALEVLTGRRGGASHLGIAGKIARNPQVWALLAGALASFVRLPMDNGLGVFTEFVGKSAAPCSLFSLGVIMAAQTLRGRVGVPLVLVGLSLVIMPLLGYFVFVGGPGMGLERAAPAILVMAGPVGLMPFVLALQYGQPTGEIARAVLWSTFLSVISVSLVLQIV